MTESEIKSLDSPKNYKKRESPMNDWFNVIFNMFDDGLNSDIIYYYIWRQPSFSENKHNLEKYIYLIGNNNFQNCSLVNPVYLTEKVFPPEITVLKRNDILKFVLTCNHKVKKDEQVGQYIEQIKEIYPVVARVEYIFKKFHATIMSTNLNILKDFLREFEASEIKSFCNSIKKDIAPVKNAISFPISSGFVEGNNNKFKLLKRIVYGRSGSVNLTKNANLRFCLRIKI